LLGVGQATQDQYARTSGGTRAGTYTKLPSSLFCRGNESIAMRVVWAEMFPHFIPGESHLRGNTQTNATTLDALMAPKCL
jgi:hypothetical protein